MTDSASLPPRIPEFGDGVQLNRLASEWAGEIGYDCDKLAGAILEAYAGGEFDSMRGSEAILGFDDENLRPFPIGKNAAKRMAAAAMKPLGDGATSIEYLALVRRGFVYVRPETVVLFAKRRQLALPTFMEVPAVVSLPKGGRPYAADWPAIEEALNREIEAVGFPHKGGEPGWRSQADVVRWVEARTGDDEPGKTTLKRKVGEMLKAARRERLQTRKARN